MADSVWIPTSGSAMPLEEVKPRHAALVRITHWLVTICFVLLLVSGLEIVISHPRFYWGETGNVLTTPLFKVPIPASRGTVPTGYGYVLPDQNGWSRYLHFQTAWALVITGLVYLIYGFASGHFRRNLFPAPIEKPGEWSYNTLQRLTYLSVVFVWFPLIIWTGLAMSPVVASVFPTVVTLIGGQQSARTLHFFVTILLVLFVIVHVVMVYRAGFRKRTGAMITGQVLTQSEDV